MTLQELAQELHNRGIKVSIGEHNGKATTRLTEPNATKMLQQALDTQMITTQEWEESCEKISKALQAELGIKLK